jgi:26S proteasome non-ATPase regulatory subunit 10
MEEMLIGLVQDVSGWTPLMIAASLKNAEGDPIIDLLLRKDADVNIKSVTGQVGFLQDLYSFMEVILTDVICIQNALHLATSKSNLSTVKTLIAHKCSARAKDKRGQLPLHRAAAVGSIPILKILLEEGKSPVNATDVDGLTALHHAVAEGHGDAAILLLKVGAEPDKRDASGALAIDLAPDSKVMLLYCKFPPFCGWIAPADTVIIMQVRKYILQTAEREGIDLP